MIRAVTGNELHNIRECFAVILNAAETLKDEQRQLDAETLLDIIEVRAKAGLGLMDGMVSHDADA